MTVNCPNCAKLIVIPVVQSGPEPKADVSEPELPADTRKGAGTKWWLLLAGGAAVIVVVLAAVWFFFPRNPETRAAKPAQPQPARSAAVVSALPIPVSKTDEVALVSGTTAMNGVGLDRNSRTRPDWFDKVQFLQAAYGYLGKNTGKKDPSVPLEVYTGQGWGFYLPNWRDWQPAGPPFSKDLVQLLFLGASHNPAHHHPKFLLLQLKCLQPIICCRDILAQGVCECKQAIGIKGAGRQDSPTCGWQRQIRCGEHRVGKDGSAVRAAKNEVAAGYGDIVNRRYRHRILPSDSKGAKSQLEIEFLDVCCHKNGHLI